jgi:alpha-tubulin suppressor-like RCC1 family protein
MRTRGLIVAIAIAPAIAGCGSHGAGVADAADPRADAAAPADASPDAPADAAVVATGPWQVQVGGLGACALHTSDGGIKCWGGLLSYGDFDFHGDAANEMGTHLPFVDLGAGRRAKALAVGDDHVCAILDNDRVKCWGNNQYGQLGVGDTRDRGRAAGDMGDALPYVDLGAGRTVRAISAGEWITCAILDTGGLKCWGLNGGGALGLGDTDRRGVMASQMGDNLPYVALGTGRTPKRVFAGAGRVCAILDDDSLKCWGNNASGALGQGQGTSNVGVAPGQMGDALAPVALGAGKVATSIVQGGESICAMLAGGGVKCWGRNKEGELALGDTAARGDDPNEMGDALPRAMLGADPVEISAAAGHACALLPAGAVSCWGSNYDGSLGLGLADNASIGDTAATVGAHLPVVALAGPARAIASAGIETCATLVDDHIQCWGINSLGQLGVGDTRNRGNAASDMGSNLPYVDLGP